MPARTVGYECNSRRCSPRNQRARRVRAVDESLAAANSTTRAQSQGRAPCPFPLSCGSRFQFFPGKQGAVLDELLVFLCECGREVAVDIELADNFAASEYRNDNLRFCLERAGQVSRIFVDVVDHHGLTTGSGRPANSL